MARVEKTVFISYRHTNAPWALSIFQDLTQHGFDAFFDFKGISSGDFETVILQNIRARAHFLILLTPSALEGFGEPGDWLRREVETALDSRRNIVPLMLEGFDFSSPAIGGQLTGKLSALKQYNALRVPVDYFSEAMDRLRDRFLNVPLDAVLHPASSFALQAAKDHQAAAHTAPSVQDVELTSQQWFERGVNAQSIGDLDGALRDYDEAIRLTPAFAEAYNNRGNTRHDKGDLEGALLDFNEAIRLWPDAHMFYNRGVTRYHRGDFDGALQDYNEALRLKPDYADAYVNRGNARSAKGDLDGALRDYNEAVRREPQFALAYKNRGIAREAKGDWGGALTDFDEAIRLRPDDAIAYYSRGRAHKARGELDEALEDFSEAIRYNPHYAWAYLLRATIRQVKGDVDGALRDYDEAIRIKPDFVDAYSLRNTLHRN